MLGSQGPTLNSAGVQCLTQAGQELGPRVPHKLWAQGSWCAGVKGPSAGLLHTAVGPSPWRFVFTVLLRQGTGASMSVWEACRLQAPVSPVSLWFFEGQLAPAARTLWLDRRLQVAFLPLLLGHPGPGFTATPSQQPPA